MTPRRCPPTLTFVLCRLAKAVVILALTISIGAHWAFLQSIAWTGMLYSYSKQAGLARAVSMTFDGNHPCSLCKTIQTAKAQEQQEKRDTIQVSKDLKLDLLPAIFQLFSPRVEMDRLIRPAFASHPSPQPDPPPPRLVRA